MSLFDDMVLITRVHSGNYPDDIKTINTPIDSPFYEQQEIDRGLSRADDLVDEYRDNLLEETK